MPIPYSRLPIGKCSDCNEQKRLQFRGPQGRICSNCKKKRRPPKRKVCAKCGFVGIPALKTDQGPWCGNCYSKLVNLPARPLEECDNCGEMCVLHYADPPLCRGCYLELVYEPKKKKCSGCKEERIIVRRSEVTGRPICNRCRQREYEGPVRTCELCDELRPVASYLDRASTRPICKACYMRRRRQRARK